MILTKSAPPLISSRAARRTASIAVADAAERAEADAGLRRRAVVVAAAEIAVAAGLAQRLAGDDEARAEIGPVPRFDEALVAPPTSRTVVKPRISISPMILTARTATRASGRRAFGRDRRAGDDMDMAVDQARHQRAALEVDRRSPCPRSDGPRPRG